MFHNAKIGPFIKMSLLDLSDIKIIFPFPASK